MGPISENLYNQIRGWRLYSVIAPGIFTAVAAFLYLIYGTEFQTIFYSGLIVLGVTCVSWWHWSMSTMITMLGIMKDTDNHFEKLSTQLEELKRLNKPHLTLVKPVTETIDNSK
jgi:hypothetical protein